MGGKGVGPRKGGELVTPEGWVPEFPGQRPPFHAGNDLALKHGAFSASRTDPIAQRFIDEVLTDPTHAAAYVEQPRFRAACWRWGTAEARAERIREWVDGMSMDAATYSGKGQTSPLELLRKWETTAANLAKTLGLDPASAARLGKDVSQGQQADAAATLTALRAQHEAAQGGGGPLSDRADGPI